MLIFVDNLYILKTDVMLQRFMIYFYSTILVAYPKGCCLMCVCVFFFGKLRIFIIHNLNDNTINNRLLIGYSLYEKIMFHDYIKKIS